MVVIWIPEGGAIFSFTNVHALKIISKVIMGDLKPVGFMWSLVNLADSFEPLNRIESSAIFPKFLNCAML